MRPLALHSPVGHMHPLAMPWAAARETPTADLYESTLRRKAAAARAAAEARGDAEETLPPLRPERARPWQVKYEPQASLLQAAGMARYLAKTHAKEQDEARAEVRRLERQAAKGFFKDDLVDGEIKKVPDEELAAKHAAELVEARAKVLPLAPPRAKRRAVWAARRRKGNELRRDLNQTLPEGAPERLTRRQLSERWRGSWQPLKTGA